MGFRGSVRRLLGFAGTASFERYRPIVQAAGDREAGLRDLPTGNLLANVDGLQDSSLWDDELLAEFCALARDAAKRSLGLRPFDVQLIGALALLDRNVIEMATGEGKTLVGAIAAAGFALQHRQVHVLSVNDYLARRDAEWMGPFFRVLGVSVGWVDQRSSREERRAAYASDVCYLSVSEAGFDVLRDRLRTDPADPELSAPDVVIVDEADAVLIDEATVPLVLAGGVESRIDRTDAAQLVRTLSEGVHFEIDADGRNVTLTDSGVSRVEVSLGVANLFEHGELLTSVNVALHAHALVHRDVDYVVRDGKIELVSAARGRVALLQRWPDGLQAAVEAKEGLTISPPGMILDSITVHSVVSRYPTVCGMSGTAIAVAEEFDGLYSLRTGALATNVPCVRVDEPDRIYATAAQKQRAFVDFVRSVHETGRPILVGTLSVAESEHIALELASVGVAVAVLNAKNDAQEAAIIARAGEFGRVTISTQMAGRGTDIRLGGEDGSDRDRVVALGGLCVIGYGRYHSLRLDDQLRGRAGRQGDPGSSVFFSSLDDELVQRNAPGTRASNVGSDGRVPEARAARAIGHAQRVAEGAQQLIHQNTLKYSTLTDDQRRVVLTIRGRVLGENDGARRLLETRPKRFLELRRTIGVPALEDAARTIVLFHLDQRWMEHLATLAEVRESIHLRALGRDSPIGEYNAIAVREFHGFMDEVDERSADTFDRAGIHDGRLDLELLGLKRPSSTWTYMVTDDPFGSPEERFAKVLGNVVRRASGRHSVE